MNFLKKYFSSKLTRDELLAILLEKSFTGEEGDHIMEDGRALFSRLSRDPALRPWIERRKANLLKYSAVTGMVADIKRLLGEYDMLISFMGGSVPLPKSTEADTTPELNTAEKIMDEWKSRKYSVK